MSHDKHTFGQLLRKARQEAGLTQPELADALEVSEKTVSRWETDRVSPPPTRVPHIAEAVRVSADALRAGSHSPDSPATDHVEPRRSLHLGFTDYDGCSAQTLARELRSLVAAIDDATDEINQNVPRMEAGLETVMEELREMKKQLKSGERDALEAGSGTGLDAPTDAVRSVVHGLVAVDRRLGRTSLYHLRDREAAALRHWLDLNRQMKTRFQRYRADLTRISDEIQDDTKPRHVKQLERLRSDAWNAQGICRDIKNDYVLDVELPSDQEILATLGYTDTREVLDVLCAEVPGIAAALDLHCDG